MKLMQLIANLMIAALLLPSEARAVPLSKVALYHRCYSQLTGVPPEDDDRNLAQFAAGKGDPIAVCLSLLDSAKLAGSPNAKLAAPGNAGARLVLNQLHHVHHSWFVEKDYHFPWRRNSELEGVTDVVDATSPALYFTRALFGEGVKARSVITGTLNLKPIRTEMNNADGARSGAPIANFIMRNEPGFRLAPTGDLVGISESDVSSIPYFDRTGKALGRLPWGENLGGGFLGSHAYLMKTINEDQDFVSDGFKLPRRWSRSLFSDVLCREFPVARTSDAQNFVVKSSPHAFRQTVNCTQCHVSMDRAASTMRGFQYQIVQPRLTDGATKIPMHYRIEKATMPSETGWPATTDASYSKRPAKGTLYYRSTLDGSLVNDPVANVADLGRKLADGSDFYICMANRYYDFFTNKGVKLNEPQMTNGYSQSERRRLNAIKALGTSLKSHQSLRRLLEEILRSPEYADSNFGQ